MGIGPADRPLIKQKRGGFVGSGPSKPPFAPMRGVGEGEKINKLYEFKIPVRSKIFTGYNSDLTPACSI
jgi:hypothetical protein